MNKQQLFSGLVGTVLTLGVITVVSADNQSWQYDAATDRVIYAFNGPDNRSYGDADYPEKPQTGDLPWQYDASTDAVIYAFSRPDNRTYGEVDNPIKQAGNLPWQYDADTDRVVYAISGPNNRTYAEAD